MKYYFAYGSNMSREQMRERCRDSEFVCVAILHGYRFVYDGKSKTWGNRSVANIVPDSDGVVYGALYRISENDERNLDKCEGYYSGIYNKKVVKVKDLGGKEYKAMVYYREPLEEGKPSEEYEKTVVNAAIELQLPEEYINNFLRKS